MAFIDKFKSVIKKPAFWVFVGLTCVFVGLGIFGYFQYAKMNVELSALKTTAATSQATDAEVADITAQVGKLMELPEDKATIATVTDAEKLRNQPFFAKSQNDDKVLIFTTAKKAILYRPSTHKIIDVAPITIGNKDPGATESASSVTESAGLKYTVILRNGTPNIGFTKVFDPVLTQKVPELTVIDRQNASRKDYETSLLIDVTGDKADKAAAFAKALSLQIGKLPEGEATPSSDFLILLGKDKESLKTE